MRQGSTTRMLAGLGSAAIMGSIMLGATLSPAHAAIGPRATIQLSGAGSTFVGPLLVGGWRPGFAKVRPDVQINYGLTGSGQGISLWTGGTVDFAASDALLSAAQETAADTRCGGSVTKIPATIGAVALIYNLPGVPSGLKLTSDLVARIFLGQIKEWSDARIQRLNPKMSLPQKPIQTVHRSDGSGTTYIVTHYLSAISPAWQSSVGSGSTVSWPTGLGAAKSSGVSAAVARTEGSFGYVDLAYAVGNKLSFASVQNSSNAYIAPGVNSASAAANAFVKSIPSDLQQVIVNAPAADAYPITGYSYIFLCSTQSGDKGKALVDFVKYSVTTGQMASASRYYAPLPASVQAKDLAALKAITMK